MRNDRPDRNPSRSRRRWGWLAAIVVVVAVPGAALGAQAGDDKWKQSQASLRLHDTGAAPDYDVRNSSSGIRNYASPSARRRDAQARLKRSLGTGGIVQVDPATGTPAYVSSRTGFLTGRHSGSARAIALGYVRRHAAAFGLDGDDLASFEVRQQYTTKRGLTHIELVQEYDGIPAFDNGLRVNLMRGRVVNVSGSPQPDLAVASTTPGVSPASAARRALADVGVSRSVEQGSQKGAARRTVLSGRNLATLVLFVEGRRTRLAWNVIATKDDDEVYRTVIDASGGEILKRTQLVNHASGQVFLFYPGAPTSPSQVSRDFSTSGDDAYLTSFTRTQGDNTWTYSDQNDQFHLDCCPVAPLSDPDPANNAFQIPPTSGSGTNSAVWNYPPVTDNDGDTIPERNCPLAGCTWNGFTTANAPFTSGNNWQANRAQNGTQVFWFVNNFHDHAQNDPGIRFDDASGNFEESAPGGGIGGDPVHSQVDDGAATGTNGQFPDTEHGLNANMLTLPEQDQSGPVPYPFKAPQMQMFLFSDFYFPGDGPVNDVNGGDHGEIVYHEYTHGISTRLVDPLGIGGLSTDQGGAMGEAWSDVYAFDYLNAQGLQPDTPAKGEVVSGTYVGLEYIGRSQPLDCPVADRSGSPPGPQDPICPGGQAPWFGGYTFGDFGQISGSGPEVHMDGEIWGETLWELREALISALGVSTGNFVWRALVTDAMRLAPADPDVLDFLVMRNAILQANAVDGFGQANCERIWDVFARRGMGADASSGGGADVSPVEGFADPGAAGCVPPPPPPKPPPPPQPPLPPGKASLASAKLSIRATRTGRFSYSFRAGAGLNGSAVFKTRKKAVVSRRAHVTVSRKSFSVPGNGRVTLRIKLSRKNLRILKRNRRLLLRVTVTVRNSAGSAVSRKNLTLRAPRR